MTSTVSTRFGELLRHARQAAGLTQAELAERAGLSVRGINDLERGVRQNPRKDTVALLVVALALAGEKRTDFEAAARRGPGQAAPAPSSASPPTVLQSETAVPTIALPTGTVTFLFTDVEGSTRLLQRLGAERYGQVRGEHEQLMRTAIAAHSGREVDTQGDSFFVAFPTAPAALAAAAEAQWALAAHRWLHGAMVRVRMGLHTGTAQIAGERYIGLAVHRAARIAAAGHGGQVLLSQTTYDLVEDALPEGASLRDLGMHRLKDLQRPEHLFQLVLADLPDLPADFPPLNALDVHSHNLPIQPTPLLGRERAVAAVVSLLRREGVRLVTLTGVGGVGKTRLGLQVAAELADEYADGVWFVPLSRLADPALVVPTIAQTLGLRESGGQALQDLLWDYMRTRTLLLLLDNFEHVAVAATAVAGLLETCAGLKVMVTSRVALHLRGEKQVQVPPLPLPEPAHLPPQRLVEYPAVALFIQQAQDADATFALTNASALAIAAICARVDGLPLAIELAAAKVGVLPPAQLLARLGRQLPVLVGGARDLPERQQTMRNTLAWSEGLLSPEDQRLFNRLAVFVGGFTLEAAEAICAAPAGAELLGVDVLEGLERLVDQHLVQQQAVRVNGIEEIGEEEKEGGTARFRLLYVIREYAMERLEASGEAEALRRAHAAYFLGLVEERALAVYWPLGAAWAEQLEREHDNFRAALTWARERGEVELGLRLAGSLGFFWYARGYYTEGRGWLEGSLTLAPQGVYGTGDRKGLPGVAVVTGITGARAKALATASQFAWVQNDNERALVAAEEALVLTHDQQAGWTAGVALSTLGEVAWSRGDLERATAYLEEGVERLRAAGEPALAAISLSSVGAIALDRGDLERAGSCCEESLALARRTGFDFAGAIALRYLGEVARKRGDLASAEALGREGLLVWQRLGAPAGLAVALENLAFTAAAAGKGARAERAARLLGAAVALSETVGAPQVLRARAETERAVAPVRAALGEERWAAAFAAGRVLSLEEAIAEALGEEEKEESDDA